MNHTGLQIESFVLLERLQGLFFRHVSDFSHLFVVFVPQLEFLIEIERVTKAAGIKLLDVPVVLEALEAGFIPPLHISHRRNLRSDRLTRNHIFPSH